MKKVLSVLVFGIFLLFATLAFAGTSVTFEWDANTETDLAGYRLYQSTTVGVYTFGSGNEAAEILVGTETVMLENIPSGTYFWVVTAYDTEGNESLPSNEVTVTLDSTSPSAPNNLRITIKVIVEVEHP